MTLTQYRNLAIAGLLLVGIGYGTGRYLQPAKVEIKKEQVIKEVERIKKDIVIVEREVKQPDGTVITERRTEDRSSETTDTNTSTKESTVVTNVKPQYRVRGGAGYDFLAKAPQYSIGGEKRFWGPVSLGLDVTMSEASKFKAAQVTASWEF